MTSVLASVLTSVFFKGKEKDGFERECSKYMPSSSTTPPIVGVYEWASSSIKKFYCSEIG
eukprot:m.18232 g.18232  ORF g.18232 m.18232 type:complete len:60 (+) comp4928_c0_seq1:175-354(+)